MRSIVPLMLIVLASKLIEESQSKSHQLNDLASEAGQNVHDVNQVPSAASADAWTIPRIGPTVTALMRRACFRFLLPRGSRSLALVFRPQRHGERSGENA